jgi:shikimate kinase
VDLDARVGAAAAIFAREGETAFRARERAALAEAVGGEGVLALGGGTVVDPGNRVLLAGWRVFVLTAPAATLRARVGGGAGRPLAGRLEALLAERATAYSAAGETIDTDGRTPAEVADVVEARCAST